MEGAVVRRTKALKLLARIYPETEFLSMQLRHEDAFTPIVAGVQAADVYACSEVDDDPERLRAVVDEDLLAERS